MVRTILALILFLIFVIAAIPLYIICLIWHFINPRVAAKVTQPLIWFAFHFIMLASGVKITVKGKENIPNEPVLFVGNHRGYFDIVVSYMTIPALHSTAFVAKKELKKLPIINLWMFILRCIFIDRSNPKAGLAAIHQAIDTINDGESVFIMPAGTRTFEDNIGEFKAGSFKIAERTGCPVVPVAITNTEEIFELHMPKIKKCNVSITFGEPISTKGLSRDEFREVPVKAEEAVRSMYETARGR